MLLESLLPSDGYGMCRSRNFSQEMDESGGNGTLLNHNIVGREEERGGGHASRRPYVGLDEFRNKTMERKKTDDHKLLGKITHRLEPGGAEYNYASSSKGAKVLDHNKEAKGAGNVLFRDRDKYLRNPCSVNGKFVVIELSEETLVDAIEIANLEHYSSNFKDFELWGSLSYPTETWGLLGSFSAENVKHAQRFMLQEPKWMRYMKLNLVSHYGSEFYCTLSFIEVYGVDAIEKMLEDLIVVSDEPAEQAATPQMEQSSVEKNASDLVHVGVDVPTQGADINASKNGVSKGTPQNPVKEGRHQVTGRIPSDGVLKILMQKMRSLELNLSILEAYIKELDMRYGNTIPDLQKELSQNFLLVERAKSAIKDLMEWKEAMEKEFGVLENWKSMVGDQVDALLRDNAFLRENVENVRKNQEIMESKELAVLSVSLFFACLALFKIICDRILMLFRTSSSEKIYTTDRCWFLILASSSMATLITLLYS